MKFRYRLIISHVTFHFFHCIKEPSAVHALTDCFTFAITFQIRLVRIISYKRIILRIFK